MVKYYLMVEVPTAPADNVVDTQITFTLGGASVTGTIKAKQVLGDIVAIPSVTKDVVFALDATGKNVKGQVTLP